MNPLKSPPPPSVSPRASRWSRALLVASFASIFSAASSQTNAQTTIFSENMGIPTANRTIAVHAAGTGTATFQNKDTLSFGTGDVTTSDVRTSSSSTTPTFSGGGNVFFTTSGSTNIGFSIEGINVANYTSLALSYGYRKESATVLPAFTVDFWNGTEWIAIANTSSTLFNETSASATGWYAAKVLNLPIAAQKDGLKIRFVKLGASTTSIRIDDVKLAGIQSTNPTITTASSLTSFSAEVAAASPSQSISVTGANLSEGILVTAPEKFEVSSDNITFGSSFSMSAAGGTAHVRMAASATEGEFSGNVEFSSAGAETKNVAVSGTVIAAGTPTFALTGATLTPFTALAGQVSTAQSFSMTGGNLTGSVTVTPPAGFEISSDGITFGSTALALVPTEGTLSQTVSVRIPAAASAGPLTGDITISSADLNPSLTVALSGTVTLPNLALTLSPSSLAENSGTPSVATVTIPFARSEDLTIGLSSGNTAAATVPATVVVSAGQTTATFDVTPVSNPSSFASNTAVITVSAINYNDRTATLTVTNVDVAPFTSISISSIETPYTQDFDGLGSVTISEAISGTVGEAAKLGAITSSSLNGWYATKIAGTGSIATELSASSGSGVSGYVYNFGASAASDRALGLLASNSNTMSIGALIKNDSAQAMTGLKFSFTAEFWKSSTTAQNTLTFEYGKVDGTSVTTSNFMNPATGASLFAAMNVTGPPAVTTNGPLDGNLTANQEVKTDVIVPMSLAPGETAFIRWKDLNDGGNDAGLAIDNMTITGLSSGIAAPEFSLVSGTYLTDQNVQFSNYASYGPGVDVFYTTDGSTPTSSSTLYNDATGIDLIAGDGSVTLKAIAIGASESLVSTGDYILPKDVANLTELRASATGATLYRVTGPATFTGGATFRNTKFFQDSGAGIQIDDNTAKIATIYTAGDSVTNLIGTLSFFEGQLQLAAYHDFGPGTAGTAPTPLSRTLATLTDADQAMLVTITGVTFQSAGSSFGVARTNTLIKDSSLADFTGVHRNIFAVSGTIPSGTNTVTGIVQKLVVSDVQTLTVGARSLSEIVFTGTPSLTLTATKTTLTEGAVPAEDEAQITVTRSGSTAEDLVVTLSESQAGALAIDIDGVPTVPDGAIYTYEDLPNTVTIPAGEASALVYGIAKNDTTYIGNRQVTLTATATGLETDTQVFDIVEDETAPTGSTFSGWAAENAGGQGPAGDFDGDGVANGVEYFFGASGSTITVNPGIVGGVISYPYDNTITGVTYKVFTTTNLTSWTDVTASTVVDGGFVKYTLPTGQSKIFVRLEVDVATAPN